jgi:hypothetical protein
VAVDSLKWLSREAHRERTGTIAGAGGNGHGCGQLGREPHTARERVESLGADRIWARTWSARADERARKVGTDCRAHARSTALAEQLRHSVITCNRFVPYNAFETKKLWSLATDYTIHYILKIFIYYGGKLCLHTWLVYTRFMQILSKTTLKQWQIWLPCHVTATHLS